MHTGRYQLEGVEKVLTNRICQASERRIHPPTGFRRRFPLEFSPAEYEMLETAGKAHGSKRAALLAGLTGLEEIASHDGDLAQALAERDTALATIADLEAKVAGLERGGYVRPGAVGASREACSGEADSAAGNRRARRAPPGAD